MDILGESPDSDGDGKRDLPLDFLLTRGVCRRSVGGTHARFQVDTRREYRRIGTLMYEDDVLEHLLESVTADDVFYDIGANVGVYSCFVGEHVDRVVAFEPHSETAAKLRENSALNDVPIDIYEYALADRTGTASLSLPGRTPHELGTGEFTLAGVTDPSATESADVIPGDTLADREGFPAPTVAKVDVEGAELETLSGFAETLRNCRRLYVEAHHDHVAPETVSQRLADLGFDVRPLKERGNTSFLLAESE